MCIVVGVAGGSIKRLHKLYLNLKKLSEYHSQVQGDNNTSHSRDNSIKATEICGNSSTRTHAYPWRTLHLENTLVSLEQGLIPQPSFETFVYIVSRFSKTGNEAYILRLFAYLHKHELDAHESLGDHVVSMLVEIGDLCNARKVFDRLFSSFSPQKGRRTEHSWNSLIMGYIKYGMSRHALQLYGQMRQNESLDPNGFPFVAMLRACIKLRDFQVAHQIRNDIYKKGLLQTNPYIGNTLIDMYVKCGFLLEAQEVFDMHPNRDVVTWTSLIAGYARHGYNQEAVECFRHMQQSGIFPNALTFSCILKACGNIKDVTFTKQMHACIEGIQGLLKSNQIVGNALVDMYVKCGMLSKARDVFDKLPQHDVVSWNALITGYSDHECGEEALYCLEKMKVENISPNAITFTGCLKACGTMRDIDKVRELHQEVKTKGLLKRDPILGSTLVATYAKCGSLAKAQEVFSTLPIQDAVAWTALISGFVQHNCCEEALKWFLEMKCNGILPDAVTYTCILKACGSIGARDKGIEIHNEIIKEELLLHMEKNLGNALVDMYAKCGMLAKAQEVFDSISVHDMITWTALITGYAQLGEIKEAILTFGKMVGEGYKPNSVTFLSILVACDNAGFVEQAHIWFDVMSEEYGITPILDHHTCMVDILARAGQLDRAVALAGKAPFSPNIVMWLTVLGACRKWGNLHLARGVFQHVVQLDEMDASAYVCMANIYVDAGMQEDANMVEAMMPQKVAYKGLDVYL